MAEPHDVGSSAGDDIRDDASERSQGGGFLIVVLVPIVDTTHARDDVTENVLGMIGGNASPRH
jgi:hypothetical protein